MFCLRLVRFTILVSSVFWSFADASPLRFPHYDNGVCPYEGCSYDSEIIAKEPTVAYKQPSVEAASSFRIAKNEVMLAKTGVVITIKPRVLKMRKTCVLDQANGITAVAGDSVYILASLGEGMSKAWLNGRYFDISEFDLGDCVAPSSDEGQYEWWIQVQSTSGAMGWVNSRHFWTPDAFGGGWYLPEADWIVLQRGQAKLNFQLGANNKLLIRGMVVEAGLSDATLRVLISPSDPKLVATCARTVVPQDIPIPVELPTEYCGLYVYQGTRLEPISQADPQLLPYIDGDYAVLYLDPARSDALLPVHDGSLSILNMKTGRTWLVPLEAIGKGERRFIDMASLVHDKDGFIINFYVGCAEKDSSCNRLFTRAERVRIDPANNVLSVLGKYVLTLATTDVATPAPDGDKATLVRLLDNLKHAIPDPPKYLYYDTSSWDQTITTVVLEWSDVLNKTIGDGQKRDQYEEFYFAQGQFRTLAILTLSMAEKAMNAGSLAAASRYLRLAEDYIKKFHASEQGALAVYQGDLSTAYGYTKVIWDSCKEFVNLGVSVTGGPVASILVNQVIIGMDYVIDSGGGVMGLDEAQSKALLATLQNVAFNVVQYPSLNGKTLSAAISSQVTVPIGHSIGQSTVLFGELTRDATFHRTIAKASAHLTQEGIERLVDRLAGEWTNAMANTNPVAGK